MEFPCFCTSPQNGPADILISKGYKLLFKIFFDLVHDEPGVIQFQLSLIRVDIPEPEAHKVILYEVKPFAGLLWIFSVTGVSLTIKPKSLRIER